METTGGAGVSEGATARGAKKFSSRNDGKPRLRPQPRGANAYASTLNAMGDAQRTRDAAPRVRDAAPRDRARRHRSHPNRASRVVPPVASRVVRPLPRARAEPDIAVKSARHRGNVAVAVLTLRVKRGLARLVLRHLVGRVLLALLAEVLLGLGDVHLRRGGRGGASAAGRGIACEAKP